MLPIKNYKKSWHNFLTKLKVIEQPDEDIEFLDNVLEMDRI